MHQQSKFTKVIEKVGTNYEVGAEMKNMTQIQQKMSQNQKTTPPSCAQTSNP
jgi:hypothetical protein